MLTVSGLIHYRLEFVGLSETWKHSCVQQDGIISS